MGISVAPCSKYNKRCKADKHNKPPQQTGTKKPKTNSKGKIQKKSKTVYRGRRDTPLSPKERRRLDKLNKEYHERLHLARLDKFRELPKRIRQKIIDKLYIDNTEYNMYNLTVEKTEEHVELSDRNWDWEYRNWQTEKKSTWGGLTLEELEEAHSEMCIEEELLT